MPMFKLKKNGFEGKLRRARALMLELFPPGTSMTLDGNPTTVMLVAQAFDRCLAKFDAVRDAKIQWFAALRDLHTELLTTVRLFEHFRLYARTMFDSKSAELMNLGFALKTRRKATSAEKVIAVAKRRATRKLRNTLGPKQRKAIKAVPDPTLMITWPGKG